MLAVLLPLLCCVTALILDRLLGEPKYHPLVLFGNIASWLERRLNTSKSRINGVFAAFVVMAIPVFWVFYLQYFLLNIWLQSGLNIAVLYFVIGWQSMKQHALAISNPLLNNDLENARFHLSMIVSRDTSQMSESQMVGSTIESILENGHDCVFASLFWFLVLGPAGALLHRLSNTLDAMWGYKNERYLQFGWFAARLDDVLGYLPARLTGLSYALSGNSKAALVSWRKQMGQHGVNHDKPYLGTGSQAQTTDIQRSIRLVEKALIVWLGLSALCLLVLVTL
jgi:adenosylcobinamide-phosphate synthase